MQTIDVKGARLSPQQFRLWHWAQDKLWYSVQCALEITGDFQLDVFQQALQHIVDSHAILRTSFVSVSGVELPMQAIHKKSEIVCSLIDLEQLSPSAQEASREEHWRELLQRPFDLEQGPLLFAEVLRLSPQLHILILHLHALCADVSTLKHFSTAILQTYSARLQNKEERAEDEPLQYVNVTAWLDELLQDEEAEEQLAHWRGLDLAQLGNTPLPFQRNEKNVPQGWPTSVQAFYKPQQMSISLPAELQQQLQITGQRFDVSVETLLLASWQTLLWRLTGNQDLLIGVLCDGRPYEELFDLVGPYARMVPITVSLTNQRSFSWILQQTQQAYQQALEKQLYFTWEAAGANKQEQRFFPLSFAYEAWPEPMTYGSLTVAWQRQEGWLEPFQLQLCVRQSRELLQLGIAYNASVFTEPQIQRLSGLLIQFLKGITEQPEMPVGSLELLTQQEQVAQQEHWRGQQRDWPFVPLHQRFQAQAQRQPTAPALRFSDILLSYQEVEQLANQLAHLLLARGVRPGQQVVLYQNRSQWSIISLLAVLKAGGCYVPLDEDLPPARVQLLLRQLAPAALICNQELQQHLGSPADSPFSIIQIEALPALLAEQPISQPQVVVRPQQDASVIYTSGSTGNPKGVQISQQSISNYTQALCELLDMQAGWHVATVSSLAADLGNTAIFCALAAGGCLHLLPYTLVTNGTAFASYVQRHPLDVLKIVPTHLQALLATGATQIIPRQRLILGGEALPWTLVEQLQRSPDVPLTCQLYNHYGPTETTIGALVNPLGQLQQIRVPEPRERAYSVPLGSPIANLRIAIWDAEHHAVPQGSKGELYIAGAGVAAGYLGAPDLTAERFLTIQQARWYRTGDLVRENEEGLIEFIERQDDQVKLRGYRIEMGEIEAHLRNLPTVREAVVQLRTDGLDGLEGDPYLVGYIIPWKHPGPDQQSVREALAQELPAHLVPRRIVCLEEFPLSSNGKLDRRNLPAPPPDNGGQRQAEPIEETHTLIEGVVQQIWRQVLGVHEIGRNDDFFLLGGHSLLGTRMIAQARTAFGVEVPITWLFETPTMAGFSRRIEETLRQGHGLALPPLAPGARDQRLPLSFAQQRLWFLDQLEPGSTAYTIPRVIRLQGSLDRPAFLQALYAVILRHENLRTTFPSHQGEPWQQISPRPLSPLVVLDLCPLSSTDREEQVSHLIRQEVARPFDLAQGPLLRSWLLLLSEHEQIFLLTLHHIISDGWSSGLLVQELTTLYLALQRGEAAELPVLPVQYADFALWQRSWLQGAILERQLDYWKTQLAGLSPLNLPTDHPRPPVLSFNGARQHVLLPTELSQQLQNLSQREGVTLFMTLLATFQVLLARYSGQQDISVGTPIANRTHKELEGLIGFFVNMLVMRGDLSGNPTFLDLLKRERSVALEAYAHQDVPFEQIVEAVSSPREQNRSPLFQVVFVLQNTPEAASAVTSSTILAEEEDGDFDLSTTKFELTMILVESQQGLQTTLEYATDLFTDAFITDFLSHWHQLLMAIIATPERPVLSLPLVPASQHPVPLDWHALSSTSLARYEATLARSLSRASLVVLDDALQPVPAGFVGQLYLGNLEGQSPTHNHTPSPGDEFLIPDPWSKLPESRLFPTGDRVRYHALGVLEYLDRQEHSRQIIHNGSLLSLDELEARVRRQTAIQNCRILVRRSPSGTQELVGYLVPHAQGSPELWQEQFQEALPQTWLPWSILAVSHLPVTSRGEIDDQALLAMAPLTTQTLAQWEQYLRKQDGVSQVAIVTQKRTAEHAPLYLSDLLPGWREPQALQTPIHEEPPLQERSDQAPASAPSLAPGKPLHLDQEITTLPQLLLRAAEPQNAARLVYLMPDGSEQISSYQQLFAQAQQVLARLRQLGVRPQDKVILHVEECQEFLTVLWGCLLGGIVVVPSSIPPTYAQSTSASNRLLQAWNMLGQPLVIAGSTVAAPLQALAEKESWGDFVVLPYQTLMVPDAPAVAFHQGEPDDLALILLTSGSTGAPKGVMQSHRSLLSQIQGMVQQLGCIPRHGVTFNWMPLDHVGGVVMLHFHALSLGETQVHTLPQYILQDPLRWFECIERYRTTTTWAPNFAFGLLNERAEELGQRQWDFSSLRYIINAGEAIVAKVARAFMHLMQPHGLSATAMRPVWGMSETCSGVTFSIFPSADNEVSSQLVEVGEPIPGFSVRLVDEHDQVVEEGRIGKLQVSGPSVTSGYYQNREATQEAFTADGWFDTGDLGLMRAGQLTITGRAKDTIIINGINYYSQEIEAVVEELEEVETSYTAACAVREGESATDQLAIFVVSRVEDARLLDLIKKVRAKVSARIGITPTHVLPVSREAIPKTGIGKIQRSQLKKEFEAGAYWALQKKLDRLLGNAITLPDWFYRRCWQRQAPGPQQLQSTGGIVLVFADESGMGETVCEQLQQRQQRFIRVERATHFKRLAEDHYQMDQDQEADYLLLGSALAVERFPITHVVYLWGYDPHSVEDPLEAYSATTYNDRILSLLHLVQALEQYWSHGERFTGEPIQLLVVGAQAQAVHGDAAPSSEPAPVVGFLKTWARELPWVHGVYVTVSAEDLAHSTRQVLYELYENWDEPEVIYHAGQRFVARLEHINWAEHPAQPSPLVQQGFYLLSGGLGGLGYELACHLLQEYQAQLLLIGRTPLAPMAESMSSSISLQEPAMRLAHLQMLAQQGGSIRYVAVDVCNLAALQQAVSQAQHEWELPLAGIFHLAGEFHEQVLQAETTRQVEQALRPKVEGTWTLHQLLKDRPGSLFVSYSSVNAFFGGRSVGAYAAANGFLEYFTWYQRMHCGLQSYCLSWSMWDEVGMSLGYQFKAFSQAQGYQAIARQQGWFSLLTVLHHQLSTVLVGLDGANPHISPLLVGPSYALHEAVAYVAPGLPPGSPQGWSVQWGTQPDNYRIQTLPSLPLTEAGEVDLVLLSDQSNTSLVSARREPQSETEQRILEIWSQVLKHPQIGVLDNFFEAGGHSLLATQVVARIQGVFHLDIPVRVLFEHPTVADLAQFIEHQHHSAEPIPPLVRVARDQPLPLSFAQQRLWFLSQLEPDSTAYSMPSAQRLRGNVQMRVLERSIHEIIRRHEALRTTFQMRAGQPVQVIHRHGIFQLPIIDLRNLLPEDRERTSAQLMKQEAGRVFDLESGPLLRVSLLRLEDQDHVLLVTMHHIISDGWSIQVCMRELAQLYVAFAQGLASPLPALPIQYADFALWQREWLQGEVLQAQLDYWRQQLANLDSLDLPLDHPRPPTTLAPSSHVPFSFSSELSQQLNQVSQQEGVTLFMSLLAAFQLLLVRYSGQEDISVGSGIANRTRQETEGLIGFFVNMLVMRTDLSGNPSLGDVLQRVKRVCLEAYAHQELPFEKLVEELQPERHMNQNPFFQVSMELLNVPLSQQTLPDIEVELLTKDEGVSRFDLELHLIEAVDGLQGAMVYNTRLFERETIVRMLGHYQQILLALVNDLKQPVHQVMLLSSQEQQLLQQWNATSVTLPVQQGVHLLFEQQVERRPEAIAVVSEEQALTYEQLDRRANQLAWRLRALGVGPEVLVGLCFPRSLELLIALLGIFKAGGAYVPLDPGYPQERLAFMLQDAGVRIIVSTQQPPLPASLLEGKTLLTVEQEITGLASSCPESGVLPENLAYVLYTSGSTGTPKGAAVTHRAIVNRLLWNQRDFPLQPGDRLLQLASMSFDIALWEMLCPLQAGAQVVLAPPDQQQISVQVGSLLVEQAITIVHVVPSLMRVLIEERAWQKARHLREVFCGGEAWGAQLGQRFAQQQQARLSQFYGPTEAAISVTAWSYPREEGPEDTSLGWPISNVQIYLLDDWRQPVPVGVVGEMYLGGVCLGRGYIGSVEMTAERFVPHPWSSEPGMRLYRTGDLGKYRADGQIEFVGRADKQMKVRGYRIEPGEIETVLERHPAILQCVLQLHQSQEVEHLASLVAYLLADEQALAYQQLADPLQQEQVAHWRQLYEDIYQSQRSLEDTTLDLVGWNSSYTREPIPAEQIQEQIEQSCQRILALSPRRVVEIGCGTGLLLLRLAASCEHYVGTDFSPTVLHQLSEQVQARGWQHVQLLQQTADVSTGIAQGEADVVILNSIVQYFPDEQYLKKVLDGARRLLREGGVLFVGDVRHLGLQQAYAASVEVETAEAQKSRDLVGKQVMQRVQYEEELLLAPEFFVDWAVQQEASGIQIQLKRGNWHNELTRFRYDVWLQWGGEQSDEQRVVINWPREEAGLQHIEQWLEGSATEWLEIRGIPNQRLSHEVACLRWLEGESDPQTVGRWRAQWPARAAQLVGWQDPEQWWQWAQRHGHQLVLHWSEYGEEGYFDALVRRHREEPQAQTYWHNPRQWQRQQKSISGAKPRKKINQPMESKRQRLLINQLREYVAQWVPEYMIPGSWVIVSEMPLTPNGKIDQQALSHLLPERTMLSHDRSAPQNRLEEQLCQIWQEVLGIEQLGRTDSFFDLGGHSLLATQIIVRVREVLQVELPLRLLFETPTVADMATAIVQQQVAQADDQALLQIMAQLEEMSDEDVQALLANEARLSEEENTHG